ncbi:MAG: hypothetical protein IRY95_10530, partial [Clostridia bacterium]|nr:hypothetical protein [Clostridia bacterium]
MYRLAYQAGYRTAFVDLADADGQPLDVWAGGQRLAGQLESIARHFGVPGVHVVAYSKGGVDLQTAIVYFGGHRHVRRAVTLATPHWGTPLADLLQAPWARRLAERLGLLTPALFQLQTGYMAAYRSVTDERPENDGVVWWTLAGDHHGPPPSVLGWSGAFLEAWGPNDGVVPVAHARRPKSRHLRTGPWDHMGIRQGTNTWPDVASALALPATALATVPDRTGRAIPSRQILRGGLCYGHHHLAFPVESGVRHVSLHVLASGSGVHWAAVSPSGRRQDGGEPAEEHPLLPGARHGTAVLERPDPGHWTLLLTSREPVAYLVHAFVDSLFEP